MSRTLRNSTHGLAEAITRLKHPLGPNINHHEKLARQIADVADPAEALPQHCGDCGTKGSFRNPLMMKPHFRTDAGGPRGTYYQARCSECMERRVRRR